MRDLAFYNDPVEFHSCYRFRAQPFANRRGVGDAGRGGCRPAKLSSSLVVNRLTFYRFFLQLRKERERE